MVDTTTDSQYQAGLKLLGSAEEALLHAISAMKRREETRSLRRHIEEVEGFLKKAKRALRLS